MERPSRAHRALRLAARPALGGALLAALAASSAPAAPAPVADDEPVPTRRAPRSALDYLAEVAPWALVRSSPATFDTPTVASAGGELATEFGGGPRAGSTAADRPAPGRGLALSPAEALEVRVNAGLEPPRVTRESIIASSFAPTAIALPSFPELPGGIVFGLAAVFPDDLVPRALRVTAEGRLEIELQGGERRPLAAAPVADLLACLDQARATRGADALVSITRGGRAQLSTPFAHADAGVALARADLAPFTRLGRVLADKSVVLDARARVVAAGEVLVPLADLELRLYQAADDEPLFGATEASLARREPSSARLARTLHFAATVAGTDGVRLDFRLQEPAWWRVPSLGALTALERDLEPAARLAGWTAFFRHADETGYADLDAVRAALRHHLAAPADPRRSPPPLR